MVRLIISLCLIFSTFNGRAQQQISFYAEDSLKVTADLYLKDTRLPFILLFHQGDASRGEYKEIAGRLTKLDYNCLAVDLRYGGNMNYVRNETSKAAQSGKFDHSMLNAERDIRAAIDYINNFNHEKVILFGSSYSASLCLLEAARNNTIRAVIAMSPGEYFRPEIIVKDNIAGIKQPVFVSATTLESPYVKEMLEEVSPSLLHFFQPKQGRGDHGAKMLWSSSESSDQCWLDLLMFFKNLRD